MSSSPSTSPVFTIHRVVKDSADAGDITNRALGMNMHGYRSGAIRVVPSANANPIVEVLFWSGEAGKFISRVHAVETGAFGAGVAFDLSFRAFGGVVFVRVKSGVGSGDTITILVAGAQIRAPESDVLLHFADATFTRSGSPAYLLDPINKQVLEFGADVLATTVIGGREYAQIEEARTQLFTQPQDLSHVDWAKTRLETPAAQTDPVGSSTAWKMIPTTDNGTHFYEQSPAADGASDYTHYQIAKEDGYKYFQLQLPGTRFVGSPLAIFNLNTGAVDTETNCTANMVDLGGGYYLCSITATSDAAGGGLFSASILNDSKATSFAGDGVKGITVWNPQLEIGASPSSPMAAAGARAKDQLSWGSALVPAAILSGDWALKYATQYADTDTHSDSYLARNSSGDYLLHRSVDSLRLAQGGVIKLTSGALTYSRNQLLTAVMDGAAGTITVSGATTGNGVHSGAAWAWSAGDLRYGMTHQLALQINGLICEPYRP